MITVAELLELDAFRRATVHAGGKGLERIVSWFCIVDIPEVWVSAGELVLSSGYGWPQTPAGREDFLRQLGRAGASGVVLAKGRYLAKIDPELKQAADELNLPLISVPYRARFAELTQSLEGEIRLTRRSLRLLLDGEGDSARRLEAGHKLGLDDGKSYVVLILSGLDGGRPSARGSPRGIALKRRMMRALQTFFLGRPVPHAVWDGFVRLTVVLQVPDEQSRGRGADMPVVRALYDALAARISSKEFFIACGRIHPGLAGIARSYDDAGAAFNLGDPEEGIIAYERSELARILLSTSDTELVSGYYLRTLGRVKEQLPELYDTLVTLIAHHFNKARTGEALNVHRNTLLYRIRRIEELTGLDLDDRRVQFELQLAAEIKRLRTRGFI